MPTRRPATPTIGTTPLRRKHFPICPPRSDSWLIDRNRAGRADRSRTARWPAKAARKPTVTGALRSSAQVEIGGGGSGGGGARRRGRRQGREKGGGVRPPPPPPAP